MNNFLERYLIETRYSLRDNNGNPTEHSYKEIVDRIVYYLKTTGINNVPEGMKSYVWENLSDLKKALYNKEILPSSPVLMNVGSPSKNKSYFSCYPLGPVGDSIEEIMQTTSLMAHIYRCGGGCGVDISNLRPKNSLVAQGQGLSSGPLSFMELFNTTAGVISQGGRRRGALMVTMDSSNEDIFSFIKCKENGGFTNLNHSVVFSLEPDEEILLECAKSAWKTGDPGVIFLKNQYETTPIPLEYEPYYVNPCAEYMSVAGTACNLCSINLVALANNEKDTHLYVKIEKAAKLATIFLNILLFDKYGYPTKELYEQNMKFRPIGVGMTGFADICSLDDYYNIDLLRNIQETIIHGSTIASKELYRLTNMSAPLKKGIEKRLNCITTVQAPAGSISQLAGIFGTGIEPIYSKKLTRMIRDKEGNEKLFELEFPHEIPDATSISVEHQLRAMSAVQQYCHSGVSKTVNLPNSATVEDIVDIFMKAYDMGIKAITVYRDGSRSTQVLNKVEKKEEKIHQVKTDLVSDQYTLIGHTLTGPTNCRIFIHIHKDKPLQIFIESGKGGTTLHSLCNALGRVISIALRDNQELSQRIASTLKGIDSGVVYTYNNQRYYSIPDAIGRLIESYLHEVTDPVKVTGNCCPDCGRMTLLRNGSCNKCEYCGYSTC